MASNTSTVGPNGRYSRDSFDRFGDDLSELILSYLSVREKRSLECVAKQWQRLIHNKTFEIQFHDRYDWSTREDSVTFRLFRCPDELYNSRRLEALLKKCTNIRKIVFTYNQIDRSLLSVIAECCPHLESISLFRCHMTSDTLQHFGRVLGPKIKVMDICGSHCKDETFGESLDSEIWLEKELFAMCPNIETLYCKELSVFVNGQQNFLPKLKSLKTNINSIDYKLLPDFVTKYGQQLKSLDLSFSHINKITGKQFVSILRDISSLVRLKRLRIDYCPTYIEDNVAFDIESQFAEIGRNCSQLQWMSISVHNINGNIWKVFVGFESLKKLDIEFEIEDQSQSITDMGLKPNLKYLSLSLSEMSEQMFGNISQFVPNLQIFELTSDAEMSDNLLNSLSGLRSLRVLKLIQVGYQLKNITDNGVIQLLDNCPELNKIEFSSKISITVQTVTKLMSFARKQPKRLIQFIAKGDDDTKPIEEFIDDCDDMPKNLMIDFKRSFTSDSSSESLEWHQ